MLKIWNEYSLWFEPQGEKRERLAKLIKRAAAEFNLPVFEPHVTLLGDLHLSIPEIMARMRLLAKNNSSFPIRFKAFNLGKNRHQCLILECEETSDLTSLNVQAQKLFSTVSPYQPHASLMYGDVSLEEKQTFRDVLKSELLAEALSFEVRTLSLWHIKDQPDQWAKIASVELS